MAPTDHLAVFTRLMTEGFAAGGDSVVDELVTADFVEHQYGLEGGGPEAVAHLKAAIRQVHAMTPDITYTIDDHVEAGETLWVRMTGHATHSVPVMGQPPTGRPLTIQVIDICRFEGGRIAEHWGVPDRFALMSQVGALRQPSQPRDTARAT
jgi:predicted ester cyclase